MSATNRLVQHFSKIPNHPRPKIASANFSPKYPRWHRKKYAPTDVSQEISSEKKIYYQSAFVKKSLSQRALRGRARARLTGALSKEGKMRGVATNVYLWKMSGKPKETGQNENSKFGSCIYA